MIKITNYKMTREQLDENATHLERAQWILNSDRRIEGEELREALQEIGDVLENFQTVRERAETTQTNWREESNAPYLKPTSEKKPEKIGRIRI